MNESNKTRLAILGTLADLHCQALPYDLDCLRQIVIDRSPDLVCAEVTRNIWEAGDLSTAEVEVREALAPVAAMTDIVLVPVAPSQRSYEAFVPTHGWRRQVTRFLRNFLRWGQRKAATPDAIHGFWFSAFCHTICALNEWAWNPQERSNWDRQNQEMVENILGVVHRDPGRRVLVVVQCQRLHRLTPLLRRYRDEIQIVPFREI
jgi:hypothetical protein